MALVRDGLTDSEYIYLTDRKRTGRVLALDGGDRGTDFVDLWRPPRAKLGNHALHETGVALLSFDPE